MQPFSGVASSSGNQQEHSAIGSIGQYGESWCQPFCDPTDGGFKSSELRNSLMSGPSRSSMTSTTGE